MSDFVSGQANKITDTFKNETIIYYNAEVVLTASIS